MLQDLSFGKLENEFRVATPRSNDTVFCFCENTLLLKRNPDDSLELPHFSEARQWAAQGGWPHWENEGFRFIFRMQEQDCFLWMGEAGSCPDPAFRYEPVRQLRQLISKEVCFAAMTAWHLFVWYRNNQYCGRCAAKTVHDSAQRMMLCPNCGNMIFPKISPAVIIAVTDGDRLLLSKYAGRSFTRYALIAGYTEIGETLEQTVRREVMEEVGLQVKHIRYYKSQPWGVDGNVLMGFYCDLDGDDTIHLDTAELSMAQWYDRYALPAHDDGISLTREMIRMFEQGQEPR